MLSAARRIRIDVFLTTREVERVFIALKDSILDLQIDKFISRDYYYVTVGGNGTTEIYQERNENLPMSTSTIVMTRLKKIQRIPTARPAFGSSFTGEL
jgi:hypothetical protein